MDFENSKVYDGVCYIKTEVIHQLYFTICCLEHLSRVCPTLVSTTFLGLAQRIRRKILTSMFIPSAILVATVYWVATWTVPKLVFNDYLEIFPRWVNHSFHTYVVPIAIFELYLCSSLDWVAELGTSEGWKNLNVYLTAYMAATAIYKISTDTWPYPFYDHMNFWMKACFVAHVYLSAWFWYYICTQLVRKVFGKRPKKRDVAIKRKHKKL